jgi:hypothetical protein
MKITSRCGAAELQRARDCFLIDMQIGKFGAAPSAVESNLYELLLVK